MAAITMQALRRTFGEVAAVDGLDLEVQKGEILGFVGPNGAGKTTTIRMVTGLLRPSGGRLHVDGVPAGSRLARRRVGLCPQENVLYPELTARENLIYAGLLHQVPRRLRRRRADDLLERLGLTAKAGTQADKLSGGMKRRLTLAMALIHDPPIVVLDEPEAGLDPQTRVAVREFIRSLRGKRTVLLTSHNMDEVERLADRVAFVDGGRLVALGTPGDLAARLGTGDTVEVSLDATGASAADVAKAFAGAPVEAIAAADRSLLVRGRGLARKIPTVLATVQKAGGEVADLRYRGTTLEDAFIALTGRRLRE
ncbi:MAG: ABC transporter ATP-binding protein [Thermoplasmatota archaeon]